MINIVNIVFVIVDVAVVVIPVIIICLNQSCVSACRRQT